MQKISIRESKNQGISVSDLEISYNLFVCRTDLRKNFTPI